MANILCIGSLIVDIINSKVATLPNENECVLADVSLNLGGSGYSTSVNFARLNSTDHNVYCYGVVGDDSLGELFISGFKKEGVTPLLTKSSENKTSVNMVLQEEDKERRYIFCEGANVEADSEAIKKIIDEVTPDVILFGEIPSLGNLKEQIPEIIEYAVTNYKTVIALDMLVTPEEDYAFMKGSWEYVSVTHCNYGEGTHISKQDKVMDIAKWFLEQGVTLSTVSQGGDLLVVGFENQTQALIPFKAEEVDATGAGDAFTAGLITKLLEQGELENQSMGDITEAVLFGCACGSIAVSSIGCVSDINREMVEGRLE